MSSLTLLDLPGNALLEIAGYLHPVDLLQFMHAYPDLESLVETYEHSTVAAILKNYTCIRLPLTGDGPSYGTRFSILDDLLAPLRSEHTQEAALIYNLVRNTFCFSVSDEDNGSLLDGVHGLIKYCRAYRALREEFILRKYGNLPDKTPEFSVMDIIEPLKHILRTCFDRSTLIKMETVHMLLSTEIIQCDNKFPRPFYPVAIPHFSTGISHNGNFISISSEEFQENLIGTVIADMDFIASDLREWGLFGLPVGVYDDVNDYIDNTGFFFLPFNFLFEEIMGPGFEL